MSDHRRCRLAHTVLFSAPTRGLHSRWNAESEAGNGNAAELMVGIEKEVGGVNQYESNSRWHE